MSQGAGKSVSVKDTIGNVKLIFAPIILSVTYLLVEKNLAKLWSQI